MPSSRQSPRQQIGCPPGFPRSRHAGLLAFPVPALGPSASRRRTHLARSAQCSCRQTTQPGSGHSVDVGSPWAKKDDLINGRGKSLCTLEMCQASAWVCTKFDRSQKKNNRNITKAASTQPSLLGYGLMFSSRAFRDKIQGGFERPVYTRHHVYECILFRALLRN